MIPCHNFRKLKAIKSQNSLKKQYISKANYQKHAKKFLSVREIKENPSLTQKDIMDRGA